MTEPDEHPDEPLGWQVLDPDGNVVATGGQAVVAAESDAGDANGRD